MLTTSHRLFPAALTFAASHPPWKIRSFGGLNSSARPYMGPCLRASKQVPHGKGLSLPRHASETRKVGWLGKQ